MKTRSLFPLVSSLALSAALLSFACSSEEKGDGDDGRGGTAGEGSDSEDSTGGRPNEGSGGTSSGGSDAGGAGGDSNGSGGGSGGGDVAPECYEAPSNLVYWWNETPFEVPGPGNFGKLQEVLAGKHATVNGSSWEIGTSYVGTALTLDEDVQVTADSPVSGTLEVLPWPTASLEFWFSTETPTANLASFFADWAPEDNFWRVVLAGGKVRVIYAKQDFDEDGPDGAGTFEMTSSDRFDDGEFHHVAVSNDIEEMEARLYVDGELVGTIDVSEEIDLASENFEGNAFATITRAYTHPLILGGDDYQGEWLEGVVDEVSVYDGPLTSAEVTGIFEAKIAGKCLPE